ncbi:MAG TPA: type II secretion system protein GspG [Longimicrobium sp.]|jgi:general secretion pathway protein G
MSSSDEEPRSPSRLWVGAIIVAVLLLMFFGRRVFPGGTDPAAARTDIEVIQEALGRYREDRGAYPTTAQGLDALRGPYLPAGVPNDPWGRPYRYTSPGRASGYDLYSLGRDGRPGGAGKDADVSRSGP